MTVGQRIAQKRRELGLSQEGLGEKLGVSRQAIYKWESDAALPEIEKLVNLSREFSVSVGWLLGEEDGAPERPELTAEQLRMVEEIVGRYLDARPAAVPQKAEPEEGGEPEHPEPEKPKRRRWRWSWVTFFVAAAAAYLSYNLFFRLDQMRQETRDLQTAVANIQSDVNRQIGTITSRVEEVLQSQNALTAEQSAQVVETDCRANTVTIQARAVPRTYVEGMTAEFTVVSGGEPITVTGELGENHAFTARITVPLTDEITASVAFLNGDQRQTQVLEEFDGLYSSGFPEVNMVSHMLEGSGNKPKETAEVFIPISTDRQMISDLRVGLFRYKKLLAWYERLEERPAGYVGDWSDWVFFRLDGDWEMEPGYQYWLAAVVTDVYGRELVFPSLPVIYYPDVDMAVCPKDAEFQFTASSKEWAY